MAESELLQLAGVGPKAAKTLEDCGFNTIEKISKATAEEIAGLPGIGLATAEKMIISAKEFKPAAKKPTAKKPTVKAEEKAIPKPKVPKAAPAVTVKKTEPRPSVKEPVAKAPVTRKPPAAKKPVTKKLWYC